MDRLAEFTRYWQYFAAVLALVLAVLGSAHAVIYKRDPRSALLWAGLIWMLPLAGAVLYFTLGVNRIRRRAVLLRGGRESFIVPSPPVHERSGAQPEPHLAPFTRAMNKVLSRPLLSGNRITPLVDGDEAYPAMLEAIQAAQQSITLCTYIFDRDEAGLAFAKALGDARRRGMEVRVLIDATGTRYSWPPILGVLRREGVCYARFLPAFPLWRLVTMNLRNHRKILVVDGRIGFTGGLNLRIGHWRNRQPSHPVQDLHFRVEGPVVAQLQEVFADDWQFTTGEALRGERWFPSLASEGPVVARGIADGPDEDFEKLRWCLLSALSASRHSVRVATPYFLPEPALISALNVAALRGVSVELLLPEHNNLPLLHWASRAHWWQVLERGCRLWLSPLPFDHSKILTVDDCWCLVGSANWDPRSLRLNFEFNIECYDRALVQHLNAIFDAKRERARSVTLDEVDRRNIPARLRDGVARLLTPYL
jgi:cardiolipin synthase